LRSDNGGEHTSLKFKAFCKEHGIKRELSCPRTPQQNGVAERKNRTLCEGAKAMRLGADLPKPFWGDALICANYVCNRWPSAVLDGKTPFEALFGRRPSVKHLKTFGCICYVNVTLDDRAKDDPFSKKGIFIGYCRAYFLHNLSRYGKKAQ
jgi:hypothetical protein